MDTIPSVDREPMDQPPSLTPREWAEVASSTPGRRIRRVKHNEVRVYWTQGGFRMRQKWLTLGDGIVVASDPVILGTTKDARP